MAMSDPLGDMLTRIRNGLRVHKDVIRVSSSKLHRAVLDVLAREGYIRGYRAEEIRKGIEELVVELKYYEGKPAIRTIKRASRPGRRAYSGIKALKPVNNYLGIAILSTPKGVLSDHEARQENVGGELLCTVF